jgi:rhodanese-related sulfurtransferase
MTEHERRERKAAKHVILRLCLEIRHKPPNLFRICPFGGCTTGTDQVDFIVANWVLILAVLLSGGLLLWPKLSGGGAGAGLTPAEAVQLMNRQKAVVIDVCSPQEVAQGHIVGARSVPLGELEARLEGAVKNKALPVILVCASGARSNRAVAIAKKLGYANARSLGGGLKSWRDANLPIAQN